LLMTYLQLHCIQKALTMTYLQLHYSSIATKGFGDGDGVDTIVVRKLGIVIVTL
jgi:hypothetical protein